MSLKVKTMPIKLKDLPSPNHDSRNGFVPEMIVLHYTGMETAKAALERLTDPASEVSAHYTVDEDGVVYRHVDEASRAWHAGVSTWHGQRSVNARSIGIEIVNPGHEFGYRPFPDIQIRSLIQIIKNISQQFDIKSKNILGHSDIAPDRKIDPGELFPWRFLAGRGIGVWPEPADEDMVKGASLDVFQAMRDFGYGGEDQNNLSAFQRHFVPEAFEAGKAGAADGLTRARLYALLAGHLLKPSRL